MTGQEADEVDGAGLRRSLLAARDAGGSWPYGPGLAPSVEATALAALALLASASPGDDTPALVAAAARWVALCLRPDGLVGPGPGPAGPAWPTAHAVTLWAVAGSEPGPLEQGVAALLQRQGRHWPYDPASPASHDTSIPGWPWVEDTHSWVEPTSWALIALHRAGIRNHERQRQGLALLRDRALDAGGWNVGGTKVFGREGRPRPLTTGLALAALRPAQGPAPFVERACAYLEEELSTLRSISSLAWALLGLTAWGRPPTDVGGLVPRATSSASYEILTGRTDLLAYTIMAGRPSRVLDLLDAGTGPETP